MSKSNRARVLEIPAFIPPSEVIEISDPQPKASWVMVTPELAMKWLEESNTNNRPIRQRQVDNLAADMLAGKWRGQNGEAIRFDTNNRLVDGQHRLYACMQSGVAFETLLIQGVAPDDYNSIGIGVRKSFGDFLGPIHGEKNVALYAAAVRLVWAWQSGNLKNAPSCMPSVAEMEQTYRDHPTLKDTVHYVSGLKRIKSVATSSYACLIHYAGAREGKLNAVQNFLERLTDGLGLMADDPVYHLRQFLLSQRGPTPGQRRAGRLYILALMVKAWNASKNEEKMKLLRFRGDEEFPKL